MAFIERALNIQIISQILNKAPEQRKASEYKMLAPILQDINFFKERKLSTVDFNEVLSGLKYREVKANVTEIRYGDQGD